MFRTYVIPDIHGRFDLLQKAFEMIGRHAYVPSKIIALGDYIDRGPQSREVLDRLINVEFKTRRGVCEIGDIPLICLKGNHEDMMWQTCRAPLHPDWWLANGGNTTLHSYGHRNPNGLIDLSVVPTAHLDWIASLPLMHVDKHRIYVHAGVSPNRSLESQCSDTETLLLKRYRADDDGGHGDYHVVHGHTPFSDGPIRQSGRTNLDTLAYETGRLVIGVFDDDKGGGPVDLIEVHGDKGWRNGY